MKEQAIISIKKMWAGYESDMVLEDVSFEMFPRDYVGLIGPNGGGKTTLIRVILGLLKPDRGSISVMGEDPKKGRSQIGYVSQFQVEDKHFPVNVWDVVSMGRLQSNLFKNLRLTTEDKEAIEQALHETGMIDYRKQNMSELSGGQRQRVFNSRALVTQPKL